MSKETVIRIGGPAMILGGVLWLVANLGHMPMEYFGGFDFDPVWRIVFPPLLIGLYALTVYAGTSYPMRTGARIALVSGAAAYLAVLGGTAVLLPHWLGSVLFLVLAVLFFGIGALREKPLPRWNGVAVLLVTPLFAFIVSNVLWGLLAEPRPGLFANFALTTGFGLVGLCWVLLGCAMLPPKSRTPMS